MKTGALFVDFDGTICFDRFWRSIDPKYKDCISRFFSSEGSHYIEHWMRGALSSEMITSVISSEYNIDYDYLWNVFVEDCNCMSVRESTLSLIKQNKTHLRTILITDNMDSFNRFTSPSLRLESYFDVIVNSCDYAALKGDKDCSLFSYVEAEFDVSLNKSVLIDDSDENCRLFNSLGGKSYLANGPDYIDGVLLSLISDKRIARHPPPVLGFSL